MEIAKIDKRLQQTPVVTSNARPSSVSGAQSKLSDFYTYQQHRGPIQVPAHVMEYQYAGKNFNSFKPQCERN